LPARRTTQAASFKDPRFHPTPRGRRPASCRFLQGSSTIRHTNPHACGPRAHRWCNSRGEYSNGIFRKRLSFIMPRETFCNEAAPTPAWFLRYRGNRPATSQPREEALQLDAGIVRRNHIRESATASVISRSNSVPISFTSAASGAQIHMRVRRKAWAIATDMRRRLAKRAMIEADQLSIQPVPGVLQTHR